MVALNSKQRAKKIQKDDEASLPKGQLETVDVDKTVLNKIMITHEIQ